MSRYDENDYGTTPGGVVRQRDLVLSINEFCFLQNKTNGSIRSHVGPLTMPISQQEAMVIFNSKTKKFEETSDLEKAKQLFISAPEGWYVILKNPVDGNKYPEVGKANSAPEKVKVGTKVNIPGPTSFALFPGQMAKTVRGHKLRSNQYLIARVYDAAAAEIGMKSATIVDVEGREIEDKVGKYFVGQLLVIKGTEVSFYLPPTGIEVIPQSAYGDDYVRDAVTLERLEYAILKDEDGEKRYLHGPAVVFPEPTETFISAPKGGSIFRALELSPISGIYVKVIANYEEDGVEHPIGEELFITGADQMIYYPRPEHAMIQYDGKYMHHAIAIPEGEGRYILNRLTGEIKTVKGPKMYLPDPRVEVVVKRKLSRRECELFYPGNEDVLNYNNMLSEKQMNKLSRNGELEKGFDLNQAYSTSNQEATLAIFEANANISRGVSYTKPRTITLDTKYDGVVSIDVWTGYAMNVTSKTGKREVVVGPTTRLLDYDETLEQISLSTGKPKTTDKLLNTVFLRVDNNKISDVISVQTKDFVDIQLKLSYCVNFLEEYKDKWFSVENYVKYLCDRQRSLLKREAKKYNIQEFYANATDVIRNIVLNTSTETEVDAPAVKGRLFKENGMVVSDVEVLGIAVERNIAELLEEHQTEIIEKTLELTEAQGQMDIIKALAEAEKAKALLESENKFYRLELATSFEKEKFDREEEMRDAARTANAAARQAEADMQVILDAIDTARLEREKAQAQKDLEVLEKKAQIEKDKQAAYAETVEKIIESISPDLIAALSTKANADMVVEATRSMSPYAIAKGESVSDTINTLLRGTSLEGILQNFNK